MIVHYKNKRLEKFLITVNVLTAGVVVASFAMLFGFETPVFSKNILYAAQFAALSVFIITLGIRLINSFSMREFCRANWYEAFFITTLITIVWGSAKLFGIDRTQEAGQFAIGIYLVIAVVVKLSRTAVNMAASGRNPTKTLILSFAFLIISGAGALMLPRSSAGERIGFIDALFTSTSATCVTGLVVKDTGSDFTMMGQTIILGMIQLGGLGIVVFGAVFAMLLGQAFSLRESVAMKDLLSAQTLGRIGKMLVFIFTLTFFIEAFGAVALFPMWNNTFGRIISINDRWFYSIFHSISAFCNAGFSLFGDSFTGYSKSFSIYGVICPLIILGGLGFGVLYNLCNIAADNIKRFFILRFAPSKRLSMDVPKRMQLQTKIVLVVSLLLIVAGTVGIMILERFSTGAAESGNACSLGDAVFQSVTARTAGFNTIDVKSLTPASRIVLMVLMFIGGSPGSTAGGIKTVTLAVVVMAALATLRKKREVEMFRRSVGLKIVGRAVTVTILFVVVLFTATILLSITEKANAFLMEDILFEAGSARGTVGLSAGITEALTSAGKVIIIALMLIGRLGPLTLLAALTFDIKPVRYDYPNESIIVG